MGLALRENSLTTTSLQLPYLSLKFLSHEGQVFLEATEFAFSGAEVRRCSRGANSVVPNVGTFRWNQAVRALCILALRYFLYRDSGRAEECSLAGGAGSLAASLDYSIAKNTGWLAEVFGSDSNGSLVVRKLITRQNPERKRPGPVVVAFTKKIAGMSFHLNEEELLSTESLLGLLSLLESSSKGEQPLSQIESAEHAGLRGGIRSALPIYDKQVSGELARYIQLVIRNTFSPYISVLKTEVWSAADAILALVRIPEAHEHLRTELPFILELLRPSTSGGYTVEECDQPIPLVTATCALALAELRASPIVDESIRTQLDDFLSVAVGRLLDWQAPDGWWTIIGAPLTILDHAENARVWDTAYITLALEHLLRLGRQEESIVKACSQALQWLIAVYDPQTGWANSPGLPFRGSPALNTLVHFVLMYSGYDIQRKSSWSPVDAIRHVESLCSSIMWVEPMAKSDFRVKGALGVPLPHPHQMNHGAFLLALIRYLEGSQRGCGRSINSSIRWNDMFAYMERQEPVYLFSQVLQSLHLFNSA